VGQRLLPRNRSVSTNGWEDIVILVALGANLPGPHGSPQQTLAAALEGFAAQGLSVKARSFWYETSPVPVSDQPNYVNGVVQVETVMDAPDTLAVLHGIEADFGRRRSVANAARVIDLDLLDFHGRIRASNPILPHPRLAERAFVLYPLRDVAPDWVHPVSGRSVSALIASLPTGQAIRRLV
jgi:2-amino-4-hydroxy-6-hydroxymethyldihydropteridine diphosphokinase